MKLFQHSELLRTGFSPAEPAIGPGWRSFETDNEHMSGCFHSFSPADAEWAISVHDFTIARDALVRLRLPRYLTVCWFGSILGRQLTPPRPLHADSIWGHGIGEGPWEGLVRGGVPVRSVSIEVSPVFSSRFLDEEYSGRFADVAAAFRRLGVDDDFPAMRALLSELWPRPGGAPRGRLHYEAKVLEAKLHAVVAYIDEHLDQRLSIDELAHLACMGPTKFKADFRAANGCTVGQYIQASRMSRAEALLRDSDLAIGRIGRLVGYRCASRFSQLFKREKGMLPSDFRRARSPA